MSTPAFSFPRLFAILFLALGGWACETDITDSVNINTKPDLVVTSFISPQDTALEVRVRKSKPVVGRIRTEEESLVRDATVRMSHGGQSVLLTFDPERRLYRAKATLLPVLAGETYTLQVTTPDQYAATAACTIPSVAGVAITDLGHSVSRETWWDNQHYDKHTFSFKWQDAPGRENYYHAVGQKEHFDPQHQVIIREGMSNEQESIFSDARKDGLVFSGSRSYNIQPGQPDPRPVDLILYLAVTDRTYYLYHQSLLQHQEANGNPFAEPVLVYSNVTGGLGVFSGYNQLKATYRLN